MLEATHPPENTNTWDNPQQRVELREWVYLGAPKMNEAGIMALSNTDPNEMMIIKQTQDTLRRMLEDPKIEMTFDLNDDTDYAAGFLGSDGRNVFTRISEVVTINGIRWHLVPGKNLVPKIVYEYLMSIPDMKKHINMAHYIEPNTIKQINR